MKQKLFLISALLAAFVSTALAVDDAWWSANGYTTSQQNNYQRTLRTSEGDWALGIVPEKVVINSEAPSSSAYTLDWTYYDESLSNLRQFADDNKSVLPAATYSDISKVCDDAVTLKKNADRDWHSAAFSFGLTSNPGGQDLKVGSGLFQTNYFFVYRYVDLYEAYTAAITSRAQDMEKLLKDGEAGLEAMNILELLEQKITAATLSMDGLTDENALQFVDDAIAVATNLKERDDATRDELINGITALDNAIKKGRWMDDIARLDKAINDAQKESFKLNDSAAEGILNAYITKAKNMKEALEASVNTLVTTADVTAMIDELSKGVAEAADKDVESILAATLSYAADYEELIPDEIAEAKAAMGSTTMTPAEKDIVTDKLIDATFCAAAYTKYKKDLTEAIAAAEITEEKTDALTKAIADAKTAAAQAFVNDYIGLNSSILPDMRNALEALQAAMDNDRWSHQPTAQKLVVKPWRSNNIDPNQVQYIKLVGQYTTTDYEDAKSAEDLFLTNIDTDSKKFVWSPFAKEDYKVNSISVSSEGVEDLNNYNEYGWNYQENYKDIIIESGSIYSTGYGDVDKVNWSRVWNENAIDIMDKDSLGNYYGRYYSFSWSEKNKGGVYRVPTELSIYDLTGDKRIVKDLTTYVSKPSTDGTYLINADLNLSGNKGYDNQETFFDFSNGNAILDGSWHHVQFIDKNQYVFHQAAQKAADWFNNNENLRHYDTAALEELKAAVETDGVDWLPQAERIAAAMEQLENSIGNVNMAVGDSLYGVIADGAYADAERTYTVTGAPGDKIDAEIIAQTNDGWTKDDKAYWTITSNGNVVGADSTATITVKFTPGTNYPADYREYRAILDVKVGGLNYQDAGMDSLRQNLYGANPVLTLKEAELLQAHSLNLHRKDSITYDLYGRGFAYLYEKSPLKATIMTAAGDTLIVSDVKGGFAKNQFTAYAADNDLDQTKFTVSFYPEELCYDKIKVAISDTIPSTADVVFEVNVAKSQLTFDPATVHDANDNNIPVSEMADGTKAYFFPADGDTYYFPIAFSTFDGVNANTQVVNEDGNITITTEKMGADGLVEEHEKHDIQVTMDNREYFVTDFEPVIINGSGEHMFLVTVKANKLEQGVNDGQHNGQLQVIWQDQDTIKINVNQTQPYFSEIVDAVSGNAEWEFTEEGDKIWYVDVNDVDNYYSFAMNFSASTNTDWFVVSPAVSYQLTSKPGTRKYRLKITYNPHEANTVYEDVLTLNIFDSKRNVVVATQSIQLKGDALSSVKGSAGATGVNNVQAENSKKDGKYFKDGKIVIVKGGQEFNAVGAQMK